MTQKKRRRGHGEGAIYQRESDGRWVAVADLGWVEGKRTRKYLYGQTRKEAADKLKAFEAEHVPGQPVTPERQTVQEFLDRWLSDIIKPKKAPRTHESYAAEIRRHLGPGLGHHRLKRLSPQDVQAYLRRKEEQGLSKRTVQYHRTILRAALNQAMRWGLVSRNVAALTEAPRIDRPERAFLDVNQAETMLEAARGDRLESLWLLTLTMGLRRGEALGLTWADVDYDNSELVLVRQLQRVGKELVFREMKTDGRRRLPLPAVTIEALKAHRKRQLEERLLAGDRWQESDLVFPSTIGTPMDPNNVSNRFKALARQAGLPEAITLHSLRHSCVSFLVAQKVETRLIMEILGHSQISTTMDLYAHILPAAKREAANAMDATFGRRTEAS